MDSAVLTGAVLTGKVIRFDETRGYGFVAPDTGAEDVFLHVNDLHFDKRLLSTGVRVQFVAEEGDRGPKASQVRMIGQAAAPRARPAGRADDDELCDVLSTRELMSEFTESLLTSAPTLTAEQIVAVRQCVARIAQAHGWTDD